MPGHHPLLFFAALDNAGNYLLLAEMDNRRGSLIRRLNQGLVSQQAGGKR